MTDALTALDQITEDLSRLVAAVNAVRTKTVASAAVQPLARAVARLYFENVRLELQATQNRGSLIEEIDWLFQDILQLASAPREKQAYLGQIGELRQRLLEATFDLMKARGSSRLVLSQTERGILETLAKMLPTAALPTSRPFATFRKAGGFPGAARRANCGRCFEKSSIISLQTTRLKRPQAFSSRKARNRQLRGRRCVSYYAPGEARVR